MLIEEVIASELAVGVEQVVSAVRLLDEGATVPFVARYRKEATGNLDDSQLRSLQERLGYLRELEDRRETVLRTIAEQGKLTPELEAAVRAAETKVRLEDLYRPFKPKRRTKAQIAREAGLEPLAKMLLANPGLVPEVAAAEFVDSDKGVADASAALDGARQILMEEFSEDPDLTGELREYVWEHGVLQSRVVAGKEEEGAKFSDYFSFAEPLKRIPSHRALALFRGRNEGFLRLSLLEDDQVLEEGGMTRCQRRLAARFGVQERGRPADAWLGQTVRWAWTVKILSHLETELEGRLRELAENEAIRVFGGNLKDLLLAAPAGTRAVMGLDPGIRTGVKVAVVDSTGKVLETATLYPHEPKRQWDQSIAALAVMAARHRVELVSIGNGTASRETDKLVAELISRHPQLGLVKAIVSEAGASVYSASELASNELPELDVSLRGAVSIARRLQDPLAELVKIDPKAIGVGQYQHDVNQLELARKLDAVVEDAVNAVGVDLNTASVALLRRVSGLNQRVAESLVSHRDENGVFKGRRALLKVPGLGPKTFEQAAGFLRIRDSENPLDGSAVHPEAYPVVERMARAAGRKISGLIGDNAFLKTLNPRDFVDERFGEPTIRDILAELEKPGRDPRPEFKTATFKEGIEDLEDLQPGMLLEGVVTNVTNFGAFVDVGVHQDGLVHISQLSNRFVRDPREVVKAGDIVQVKVQEVDPKRRRIGLTMKLEESPSPEPRADRPERRSPRPIKPAPRPAKPAARAQPNTAMAQAFSKLKKG